MIADTWARLDATFEKFPVLKGEPVPAEEIVAASASLGTAFPNDYREFLLRFGGGIVGPFPIFGLRPVEPMGNEWSVLDINRRYRADGWPGVDKWVVVSADHSGNPVGIDREGRVWLADHDQRDITLIADTFEDFLRRRCLRIG